MGIDFVTLRSINQSFLSRSLFNAKLTNNPQKKRIKLKIVDIFSMVKDRSPQEINIPENSFPPVKSASLILNPLLD
jgi:hypothetical protein